MPRNPKAPNFHDTMHLMKTPRRICRAGKKKSSYPKGIYCTAMNVWTRCRNLTQCGTVTLPPFTSQNFILNFSTTVSNYSTRICNVQAGIGWSVKRSKSIQMLDQDVIEQTKTEQVAPVVFALNNGETIRFRADYRKLNALTERDSCLLPHMDKCIESLRDATVLFTPDGNSGYLQMETDKSIVMEQFYR